MKQQRLDVYAVVIVLANTTMDSLESEDPWTAVLLKNLGVNALAPLIVRKSANLNPKSKKVDLVLQVGVLWATK